jgi:hypothetical protein
MTYQEIFLSGFFGGLGLGLAAIFCLYLAATLDRLEGGARELLKIRKALKKNLVEEL